MKMLDYIFYLATVMRVAGLWIPQLWYDENFTLILARLPFDRMIAATAGDVHPPLWYLIEWMFIRLSPHPMLVPAWTLRIPAFIFSLLALVVFRRVLDELHIPERVQIGALVLMAILPMQLWYAQEARMYSLLELEVLLALLYALRFNWLGLFITSTAMLYTQNYSVFYLACIWLVVVIQETDFARVMNWNPGHWRFATLSMAGGVILFIPWVKVIAVQVHTISGRYWIQEQSIGDVLNTVYKLFWTSSVPSFALFSALLITFMAISVGLLHMLNNKYWHWSIKAILIMAFGPLALAWIASVMWQPILLFRPLIGIAPFLYAIVAWSLEKLFKANQFKTWREAAIASALVIPIFVSGLGGYYKNIPAMKSDGAVSPLIDALAYVKANWRDGDVIYYTDDGPMINLSPYAGDLPQYAMAACGDRMNVGPVLGSLSPATRTAIGIPVKEIDEIEFKRAWVFAPRSPLHPICYEEHIAPLTVGSPLIVVDDNEFISSGVWLVVK